MGKRRCRTLRVVCMDMWAPYAKLVRDHPVNAQILLDRSHIVQHLNEAVDADRRELWGQLTTKQRVSFKEFKGLPSFVSIAFGVLVRFFSAPFQRLNPLFDRGVSEWRQRAQEQSTAPS